jgi:hypothetical protein
MDLKNISDDKLLEQADALVRQEREILIDILHHLREIDRRQLFSALRYTSLFDYCMKRLRYSEDQACRRIAAMRLMVELPELEQKISSGSLSLTNIGRAQTLFRAEKKSGGQTWNRNQKLEVIENLLGQSRRNAEKVILKVSSNAHVLTLDRIKSVSESKIEITFVAPEALQEKMDKLKGLLAHRHPYLSLADLFDNLCELGLQKYDPCRQAPRAARVKLPSV